MPFDTYETSTDLGSPIELYLFETADGLTQYAFTQDSRPHTVNSIAFLPCNISRDELQQSASGDSSPSLSINMDYNNPVAVLHASYLPPTPVKVTIFRYQRFDLGVEVVQAFKGEVSSFSHQDNKTTLSCSQVIDAFSQVIPWAVFGSLCIWALYGIGCGISKELFKTTVVALLSVTGAVISASEAGLKPDGWFTNGFAVNPVTGETRFIIKHVGDDVTLIYPFADVSSGDAVNLFAGCDRSRPTCRDKFDNTINRVAFQHIADHNVYATGVK